MLDISTGRAVPNRYVGRDIPVKFINSMAEAARPRKMELPAEFSTDLYLAVNPDVKVAGIDPVVHYLEFGAREGS